MSDSNVSTEQTPGRSSFEIGHMTFVEITEDPRTGRLPSAHQRSRETIEQARLADQVGLDLFAVGEHHRTDFVGSAPAMVLAAAAEATENIRLTSSVTVLSSEDPVRVWEQFATLDQFSGGRAEIIAGRGSYTESFPLFGYDLADYADLFREKLDLLLKIRSRNPLTWSGRFRPALDHADIGPRAVQDELPIWVGVGGTPASAVSTGRLGLPMAMALLMGPITSHEQTIEMYRAAAEQAGHDPAALRTSINLHGYVGRTSQGARDTMYPYFARGMMDNNHQRGQGFQLPRAAFDAQTSPNAGLVVGSAQEVIDKLLAYHEIYGLDRALIQIGFGGMPQKDVLESIEILGTEVAPVVRREVAARKEKAA
ncbi:LLM class flavin-dependent oxidoreductase [Myceligenerans pegani]|uniref:LLM class flavin-dependent oxidoreductase n=1 Tax=Myceligenerans pegani TaxID=2776917 RepID=A0ABR9N6H4_9MICO|nr:LLM class flavin-dependent oxidoreductase [Myceligenerans sp. TRM 65318]MBE1878796.1 LLM class flavin-dependent oxidoreductase [Myceligenerans sp. TRM 65318]MBE3021067.1 LLM class flavin-dependent oxidoreductase [Myceligenerans sp. TRM 65318]